MIWSKYFEPKFLNLSNAEEIQVKNLFIQGMNKKIQTKLTKLNSNKR